jgi:hypothetical protein
MSSQNHNLLLTEKFSKLTSLQKEKLASEFRNAPLMVKLIEFLEKQGDKPFTSHLCINKVYGIGLSDADYRVIENRFFKLRKKLLDRLSDLSSAVQATLNALDEEMELRECIDLLNKGQKDLSYKRLEELEKRCWQKNLFELLPRILDRLIFCNQSFNRIEANKAIYLRYDEAVRLNTLILQVQKKVRQVYEINYQKGITAAKSELRFIKKVADNNPKYPRFEFIYHHLSLYYKLGSSEYLDKMQVLGKHHAAVKKIYSEHGNMTIFYTPNYEYYQEVHLKEISIFYLYNKCDFEEAYQESCALKKFISNNDSPKAESFFYNAFRAELAAGKYTDAKQTLEEYAEMLRRNNQTDRMPFVHALHMMLYVFAYPKMKLDNLSYTEKKFDQYIKWAQKNRNLITPYEEALVIKAGYNHIREMYDENLSLLKEPALEKYFESKELHQAFANFTKHFAGESRTASERKLIREQLDALKFKVLTPNSALLLRRMSAFVQ